jgi:hypothetical protein
VSQCNSIITDDAFQIKKAPTFWRGFLLVEQTSCLFPFVRQEEAVAEAYFGRNLM